MINPNFEDGVWMLIQVTIILGGSGLLALVLQGRRPALASGVLAGSLLASAGVALPILYSPLRWSWAETTATRLQTTSNKNPLTAGGSVSESMPTEPAESTADSATDKNQYHALATTLGRALDQLAERWVAPAQDVTQRVGLTRNQVLTAWIGTAIWAWAILSLGLGMLRRHRRLGRRIDDPQVVSIVRHFSEQLSIKRIAELREASVLCEPSLWGMFRPIIVLPSDWRTWEPSELRSVLAHEVSHQARGDWSLLVLARMCRAIHLYHPLTHWVFRRLQLEQELAADLLAVSLLGDSGTYARSLMRLALQADRQSRLPQPVLAWGGSHLLKRIKEMNRRQTNCSMRKSSHRWHRALTRLALVAGAIASCCLAMGIRPLTAEEKSDVEPKPTKKSIYESHGTAGDIWIRAKFENLMDDRALAITRTIAQGYFDMWGAQVERRAAFSGKTGVRVDRIRDAVWDRREDAVAVDLLRNDYVDLGGNQQLKDRHRLTVASPSQLFQFSGVHLSSQDLDVDRMSRPDQAHLEYLRRTGPYTWRASEIHGRQAYEGYIGDRPVTMMVADGDNWFSGNRNQIDEYFKGEAKPFGDGIDDDLRAHVQDADLAILIGPEVISLVRQSKSSGLEMSPFPPIITLIEQVEQIAIGVWLKDEIEWSVRCRMRDGTDTNLLATGLHEFFQAVPLGVIGDVQLGTAADLFGMRCEGDGIMLTVTGQIRKSIFEQVYGGNLQQAASQQIPGWLNVLPLEPAEAISGITLCPVPGGRPQCGVSQTVDASEFRGRRLSLSVHTSPIPENAKLRLWAVADDEHRELISGETVWLNPGETNAMLHWDVPSLAQRIAFGASAIGEVIHVAGFEINDAGPMNNPDAKQVPAELGRFSYLPMLADPNKSPVNLDLQIQTEVAEKAVPAANTPVKR